MPILSPENLQTPQSNLVTPPADSNSSFDSGSTGITTFENLPKTTFGSGTGFGDFYFFGAQIQDIKIQKKKAVAIHEIPYQDADLLETLGNHSATIDITLWYLNAIEANAYPQFYLDLYNRFMNDVTGYLTLPSGNQYYCKITELSEMISLKHRDGAEIKVQFKETLPVGNIAMPSTPSLPISAVPALNTVNLNNVSFDNLNNISKVNSSIADITNTLSQGFVYALTAEGQINSFLGKIQNVLDLIDLIDQELPGEYAYLRVFLIDTAFQLFNQAQKIQASNKSTVNAASIYNVQGIMPISKICNILKIGLDQFFQYNPMYLGQLSVGPDQIVVYVKTGNTVHA